MGAALALALLQHRPSQYSRLRLAARFYRLLPQLPPLLLLLGLLLLKRPAAHHRLTRCCRRHFSFPQ